MWVTEKDLLKPKEKGNYQDLLKFIALICMVIDHLGLYMFPDQLWMRLVGRVSMPLFCLFAGYNFKGQVRYSLLMYGGLLYAVSYYFIFHLFIEANILISIFLGQLFLKLFLKCFYRPCFGFLAACVLGPLAVFTDRMFDYGTLSIACMVFGYMIRKNEKDKLLLSFGIAGLSFVHSFCIFKPYVNAAYMLGTLSIYSLFLLAVNYKDFSAQVRFCFQFITRRTMGFYVFHLFIIRLFWRYDLVQYMKWGKIISFIKDLIGLYNVAI